MTSERRLELFMGVLIDKHDINAPISSTDSETAIAIERLRESALSAIEFACKKYIEADEARESAVRQLAEEYNIKYSE